MPVKKIKVGMNDFPCRPRKMTLEELIFMNTLIFCKIAFEVITEKLLLYDFLTLLKITIFPSAVWITIGLFQKCKIYLFSQEDCCCLMALAVLDRFDIYVITLNATHF